MINIQTDNPINVSSKGEPRDYSYMEALDDTRLVMAIADPEDNLETYRAVIYQGSTRLIEVKGYPCIDDALLALQDAAQAAIKALDWNAPQTLGI